MKKVTFFLYFTSLSSPKSGIYRWYFAIYQHEILCNLSMQTLLGKYHSYFMSCLENAWICHK